MRNRIDLRKSRRPDAETQHCKWCWFLLIWQVAFAFAAHSADAEEPESSFVGSKGIEFFEQHIRPVLVNECYECHSAQSDSVMGGLRVDTREHLLQGGESGAAIEPGNADDSLLVSALKHESFEMPPEGKLDDQTIRNFEAWIRMGAPDPRTGSDPKSSPSAQRASEPHWAFEPILNPPVPSVKNKDWPQSPIDQFVLKSMEDKGLEPVREADRVNLIRRAYFDLWGLPPSPQAVRVFLSDPSPDAFPRLIDRLLDAMEFGQRWGRYWLDVARFGESTGHERNFLYPHAWRYRDYVIDAFRNDKPFDRFLLEQLAGDLLPADDQITRDHQHQATGFLAIGPRNLLGSSSEFEMDSADDQINVTTRAFLGLTVACARCHDHKFDPVSTREYYSLAGIFLSSESLYGTQPGTGGGNNRHPSPLIPLGKEGQEKHSRLQRHQQEIAKATEEYGKAASRLKKLTSLPEDQLDERSDELAVAETEHSAAKKHLEDLEESAPPVPPYAMGIRDAKSIGGTEVRISGDPNRKGDRVERGVLACCTTGQPPQMPTDSSGRLELARWMVSDDHPLTSRVAVNRIWHHLMGRGIVSTVDNLGVTGRQPSHPELLDWLATRFRQDGWSVKRMIRLIMTSRVYQLSATHNDANEQIDPGNVFHWRRSTRRLDAEAIRDALLATSGELQRCPPESGSVVALLGDGCLVRQIDAERLRTDLITRSVYLPTARFFEPEVLQVFDGASASLVVGDRAETNTPAQSLYMLNNPFVIERARMTARRLLALQDCSTHDRVSLLYQFALSRDCTVDEKRRAVDFLDKLTRTSLHCARRRTRHIQTEAKGST